MDKKRKPRRSQLNIIARGVGNSSVEITLPKNIVDLMEIKPGDQLELDFGDKKYGKRLSIWNYKQQMKEYNREK